jgi:NAD+-dependent protein deacetylase sirtuin 4
LDEMIQTGALNTEDPNVRRSKGLRSNPDGDVDIPGAPYSTFRYPACPTCLAKPPILPDGTEGKVEVDSEGGWLPTSTAGVLKPSVVFFGESIAQSVKTAAEEAIDSGSRLLVIGTSLATYSAWRLAKRAKERGMPVAILNLGGVRSEETFFETVRPGQKGEDGCRLEMEASVVLPGVVDNLKAKGFKATS